MKFDFLPKRFSCSLLYSVIIDYLKVCPAADATSLSADDMYGDCGSEPVCQGAETKNVGDPDESL